MGRKLLLSTLLLLIYSTIFAQKSYDGHLPSREEILDKIFLVTVGEYDRYEKCLEEGILSTRHNPVMSNYQYSNTYDGVEAIEPYICVREAGRVYFSPGRATELYPDFEIGFIIPLRNVLDKLVSVSWQEFITFDEIELGKGIIIVAEDDIEIPQKLLDRGVEVHNFEPEGRYSAHGLVKDIIRKKGGWVVDIEFNEKDSTNFYYIEGASIDGIYVDFREFLEPLERDNVGIGIKHIAISGEEFRASWLGEKYSGRRNFGFEFYALKYQLDQYYKWHANVPREAHKNFDEYVKALMVSWDVLSYERKVINLSEWERKYGFNEAVALASVPLGKVLDKELKSYEGLNVDETFEKLMKKGVYNFESINSSRKGFRNSFLLELFVLREKELPGFIQGYKDYLAKYSIKPPYPMEKLEDQMLKIAQKHRDAIKEVERDFKALKGYNTLEEKVLFGNTNFVEDFLLETFEMDALSQSIKRFIENNKSTLTRKVEPESPEYLFLVEALTNIHTNYHMKVGNIPSMAKRKLL